MVRKWTQHGLTNEGLKRLSAICNGRPHKSGTSLAALESRGLVEGSHRDGWKATDAGYKALDEARREGW